jgi:hypothetical protein
MNKTLKIVLVVLGIWLGLGIVSSLLSRNSGLSESQRRSATIQVQIEACVDEANKSTEWGKANVSSRQYCTCVVNKVVDKVGLEGLDKYEDDDVDQVIKDFYPEIKVCLEQVKET